MKLQSMSVLSQTFVVTGVSNDCQYHSLPPQTQTYILQLLYNFSALSLSSEVNIKNASYKVKCNVSFSFVESPLNFMKTQRSLGSITKMLGASIRRQVTSLLQFPDEAIKVIIKHDILSEY